MAMVTGLGTTALGRRRLVNLLAEQHKLAPYDAMYNSPRSKFSVDGGTGRSFPQWCSIRASMRRGSCTGCGTSANCHGVVRGG